MQIADGLPEKYQQVAFGELLRYSLHSSVHRTADDMREQSEADSSPSSVESEWDKMLSELPPDYTIAGKGSRDQQTAWAVIKLHCEGLEATPASVVNCIKAHLCIPPESDSNTSKRLKGLTPRYLMRKNREEGKGYVYESKPSTIDIFKESEE